MAENTIEDKVMAESKMIPMYSGKPEDFCCIGFGSGTGTNLGKCAEVIDLKLIYCDVPDTPLLGLEALKDVPKIVLDSSRLCGKRPKDKTFRMEEYKARCFDYNQRILDHLKGFEKGYGKKIDLIVLGGYMRIVGKCLLEEYADRIINVHPADLTHLTENYFFGTELGTYRRTYIGADAVTDALKARESATRSSVIIADEGVDHGEILVMGPKVKVDYSSLSDSSSGDGPKSLKELALMHQTKQKELSDWPALTTAVKMIAEGRVALGTKKDFHDEWRTVYVDGKPMGYGGYQIP